MYVLVIVRRMISHHESYLLVCGRSHTCRTAMLYVFSDFACTGRRVLAQRKRVTYLFVLPTFIMPEA